MWNYEIVAQGEKIALVTVERIDEDEPYTYSRTFTDETKFRAHLAWLNTMTATRRLVSVTSKCACGQPATSAVKVDFNGDIILFCEPHRAADHARRVKIAKDVQRKSIEAALNVSRGNTMLNGKR